KFLALNTSFGTNAAPVGGYALGTTFSISTWYFVSSLPAGLRSYIYEGLTNDHVSAGNPSAGSTTLRTYNIDPRQDFTGAMATGTWRHLAQTVTLAGGTSTMVTYLDGIASGTLSTSVSGGSPGINLATARSGTNPPTTSQNRPLNGTLDETAVWQTKALSAAEVLAVYNRGLAGVSLTNTATVAGYAAGSTNNAWLTGTNWASGTAPGQTGSPASTNGNVAVVGNHAFGGGLGIDMAAATGNLALGAITFNSLAGSGGLSIGNSAAANGTLTLNGAQIDGFENVVLNNEGLSNLTITNVQGSDAGQRMTLQLGGTTNMVRTAAGRTLTITTDIIERAAGSSLTVDGGGTVVLGGTNTYSGGTVVSAGRLAGTTASLQGLITNNATVEFVQTVGGTYAGSMTGTGALIKTGSGLLTFAGNNTFSGLTTISAGRVVGSTASLPSAVANSAELEFAQASAGTFAAVISGTGSLEKTGTGNLILSGASTYTGLTTVAAGRLSVDGSLGDTPVAVLAAAELGGSGSIAGPVSIAAGGFLAPGNSIASLATGTATFAAGATFAYEVDSTNPLSLGSAADVLVVSGNLNLDPGNGTLLTFTDLASSIQPFVEDTTIFALINYSGSWNGGLFTYGSNVLTDGERFTVGSQLWEIDYNRTSSAGLDNFTADYLPSSNFVTVTAVPEPSTYAIALAGIGCGGFSIWRRRTQA
ncbi:MAG: autotransporter-associated beta strand repeat-containing protein, partial [Planctomycetia bacterium]